MPPTYMSHLTYVPKNCQGVRPRSSLMTLFGMEFVDPAVCSCLQWEPWNRPQASALLEIFSVGRFSFPFPQPCTMATLAPQATSSHAKEVELPTLHTGARQSPLCEKQPPSVEVQCVGSNVGKHAAALPQGSPLECESGQTTGNPKYGRCEVEGCQRYRLRKHIICCWRHLDVLLPNELRVVKALQSAELLQHLFPCDLVSAVLLSGKCAKLGKSCLPFAIVSFLKIPSASAAFIETMVAAGDLLPKTYAKALDVASTSKSICCLTHACRHFLLFFCMNPFFLTGLPRLVTVDLHRQSVPVPKFIGSAWVP